MLCNEVEFVTVYRRIYFRKFTTLSICRYIRILYIEENCFNISGNKCSEEVARAPDKRVYLSSKAYVVGTQKKRLNVLLSTLNKC